MTLYKITGVVHDKYVVAPDMYVAIEKYMQRFPADYIEKIETISANVEVVEEQKYEEKFVVPDYTIKIKTKFCEWAFELSGSEEYSIKNLIDIITESTQLHVDKNYLVK